MISNTRSTVKPSSPKHQFNKLKLLVDEAYLLRQHDRQEYITSNTISSKFFSLIKQQAINIRDEERHKSVQSPKQFPILLIPNVQLQKQPFISFASIRNKTLNAQISFSSFEDQQESSNSSPRQMVQNYLQFNENQKQSFMEQMKEKQRMSLETLLTKRTKTVKPCKQKLVSKIRNKNRKNNLEEDMLFMKKIEESRLTEKKHTEMMAFQYQIQSQQKWKPAIRERATMTMVGSFCYLYGGQGEKLHNDICELNLNTLEWVKIEDQKGDVSHHGRVGHTCVVYNKILYIFGGEKSFNQKSKQHECLNDTKLFLPNLRLWKSLRCYGEFVEGRRQHSACVVGKFMIIYGGMNSLGYFLNDFQSLNLESLKWQILTVDVSNELGLAYHKAIPIFKGDILIDSPYQQYELIKNKNFKGSKIKYEGIYIFGGINKFSECSDKLLILQLGTKPLKLITPEIQGIPPLPRYQHSMNYNDELNLLVIYGGRNDQIQDSLVLKGFVNDIKLLLLETMTWVGVQTHGITDTIRNLHCAINIDSKIIIFGGLQSQFANTDLLVLEFNQSKIKFLQKINRMLIDGKSIWKMNGIMQDQDLIKQYREVYIDFFLKNLKTIWLSLNDQKGVDTQNIQRSERKLISIQKFKDQHQ